MKFKIITFLLLFGFLFSCKNDSETRIVEQKKEAQKKELIFNNINKGWVFAINQVEPKFFLGNCFELFSN